MELLSSYDEFVSFLATNEKHGDFRLLDIIQDSEVCHTQLVLRERIGS